MRESSVCWLISETYTSDELLQQVPAKTYRMVYCNIRSLSRTEWAEASRNGLNPEMMLEIFDGDYDGEEYVNIGGMEVGGVVTGGDVYGIYRTYRARGDVTELYLERRQGAQ